MARSAEQLLKEAVGLLRAAMDAAGWEHAENDNGGAVEARQWLDEYDKAANKLQPPSEFPDGAVCAVTYRKGGSDACALGPVQTRYLRAGDAFLIDVQPTAHCDKCGVSRTWHLLDLRVDPPSSVAEFLAGLERVERDILVQAVVDAARIDPRRRGRR